MGCGCVKGLGGERKAEGVSERRRLSIHKSIGMDRETENSRGIFTLK